MEKQDAATPTTSPTATTSIHELFVRRHDGRWLVTDERDNASVKVRRKDKIRWIVEDEAAWVAFQFPYVHLFRQACENQQWKWSASQSKPLELTIAEDAPLGEHTYAAFCLLPVKAGDLPERVENGEIGYAEGGSPPRMIIME